MHSGVCWCAEETLLGTNFQQLLQWRERRKSGGRLHSGRRRGVSAAGSDWSLHSTEEGLLEQRASEISRTDTVNHQK